MSQQPKIIATSQQSRFHTETLDTSIEVDIKDVTISIAERELITDRSRAAEKTSTATHARGCVKGDTVSNVCIVERECRQTLCRN